MKEKIYFPEKVRKNMVIKLALTSVLAAVSYLIGFLSFVTVMQANDDISALNIMLIAGAILLLLVPSFLWWFNFYYKNVVNKL